MSDWSGPPPSANQNPTHNPYAPPSARLGMEARTPDDAERIRREHLSHEASLRSIGTLYGIGAILTGLAAFTLLMVGIFGFVFGLQEGGDAAAVGLTSLAIGALYGLLSWLQYFISTGLRDLESRVRTLTTIFSVIGLLAFPLGTLINGYILYLLHSEKGKRIMTPEYRAVVASTPQIQYKTPLWMILVVIALIAAVVLALIMATSS